MPAWQFEPFVHIMGQAVIVIARLFRGPDTKITRNVNVPWYDSLVNARTGPAVNQTVVSGRGRQRAVF